MYSNRGELSIENADDANVPVDIHTGLIKPNYKDDLGDCPEIDENDIGKYYLFANNYMPRKARLGSESDCVFFVVTDTKEELQAIVNKFILPLYQNAIDTLKNINKFGYLYYWNEPKADIPQ